MILTLAWKEMREHQAIWITMIVLTVLLGVGLGEIIESSVPGAAVNTATMTILGLAAVYGIVCGGMMLAGEDEAGTLPFLDIFHGRRFVLWFGKFAIGTVFVLLQSVIVGAVLYFMNQPVPLWARGIFGVGRADLGFAGPVTQPGPEAWLFLLPLVTLEAFAWGLFGSALSRRVLAAAAIAVATATPIWLIGVATPAQVFLGFRIVAAVIALGVSLGVFVNTLGYTPLGPMPPAEPLRNRRREFLERWERVIQDDWERSGELEDVPVEDVPVATPALVETDAEERQQVETVRRMRRRRQAVDAGSPGIALWGLCFQQAWGVFLVVALVCFVVGFFVPLNGQLVWPLATFLVGVACGTATFGAEQRDLSYQFLSAQHLPLKRIWTFKVLFWLGAAVLAVAVLLLGGGVYLLGRNLSEPRQFRPGPAGFEFGTLRTLLGPVAFFGVWLVYGFWSGQLFVWLCRKMLLALALSTVVGLGAILVWLPPLLAGGTLGWQMWLAPLTIPIAAMLVLRAWAGGRIKERRPLLLLIAFAVGNLLWLGANYAYRAWEFPGGEEPLDRATFRASVPSGASNQGGQKLQEIVSEFDSGARPHIWLGKFAEAQKLPLGTFETPSGEGQSFLMRHLPSTSVMGIRLREMARTARQDGQHELAMSYVSNGLLLSRTLRTKAPLESYVVGVQIEEGALAELEESLKAKPDARILRAMLEELNRHQKETPGMIDCLQTECYRSGGMLHNPSLWSFTSGPTRVPEPWLVAGITMSLNLPWETERKERLWRAVWSGLFRNIQTPQWKLPAEANLVFGKKDATRRILRGWMQPADASLSATTLADWLDDSWLADDKLFTNVASLRTAGMHSAWQIEATRIKTAMALYQVQEGKAARTMEDLVPRYLPESVMDPYTGRVFALPPGLRPF